MNPSLDSDQTALESLDKLVNQDEHLNLSFKSDHFNLDDSVEDNEGTNRKTPRQSDNEDSTKSDENDEKYTEKNDVKVGETCQGEVDNKTYHLEKKLRKFIEKDKELIAKLTEICDQVKSKRKNCNIAKTTGVSISGTGTVMSVTALCLAPFTAGASLAVIGIPAVLTSIVGGLTAAGANIAEGIASKSFLKEAQDLQEEQIKLAHELTLFKERTNGIVDQLIKWGWDEEQALESVLKSIKSGLLSPVASKEESILADAVLVEKAECKFDSESEDNPKIGHSGGTTKIASGILGVSAQAAQAVHKFTPIEAGITAAIFRSSTATATTSTLRGVFTGVAAAAGVAFTVVDIVYLVKSWKNDHPLIPQIELIISALQEDINDCEKILEVYELL